MFLALRSCLSLLAFLLISITAQAQPDEAYVRSLTGTVNPEWLIKAGSESPEQILSWTFRALQGFENIPSSARPQASLEQSWIFYTIDSSQAIHEAGPIDLPHSFDQNRDYASGWYLTKFDPGELGDKWCVLMLDRVELFSMVYVNGQRIGHHFGSYTPFEFDVTGALVPGVNQLAIFVYDRSAAVDGDKVYSQLGPAWLKSAYSQGKAARVLPGGLHGIPVLELREKVSVKDVFVKTSTRRGEMEIEYELSFSGEPSSKTKLSFELFKWPEGQKVDLKIPGISLLKAVSGAQSSLVKWSDPDLWSPDHPNLYVLRATLQNGKKKDVLDTRFGFREFWVERKTFMLNGVPTRLRGESHYRPIDSGKNMHQDSFFLYKKLFGTNACRIHAFMPPGDIMRAADEVGVLLINQSAIWSVNVMFYKNGGEWFLKNVEKEYEEWARRDRNCPSVVIWDVENEMLRYNYELHLPWVSRLPGFIEKFDDTRPFNFSGAGFYSPDADMASLHMQEHYTRIMKDWKEKGTFPLLMGEFWVGGRMEQRIPTSPEFSSVHQRYLEEAKIYEEKFMEMRYLGVTGVMPFRTTLLTKASPQSEDVVQKLRHGLQDVSLFFWPRQDYVAEGEKFQRELVLCNDSETAKRFDIVWGWENQTHKRETVEIQAAGQKRLVIEAISPQRPQKLIAEVSNEIEVVSADTLQINPLKLPKLNIEKAIRVYKDENLVATLIKAGYNAGATNTIPDPEEHAILIIPEHADNRELNTQKEKILDFLDQGGAVLCLKQDQAPSWFPIKFHFWSANQTSPHTYGQMGWEGLHKDLFYSKTAPLLATTHPVLSGFHSPSLHLWDSYDGRVSDDVFVRPASVNKYEQGNWRTLTSGSRREHVSLAELFYGKGVLLSCQLNIIENIDNAQATRLLGNMLDYLDEREQKVLNKKVEVRGCMDQSALASLTGASLKDLQEASAGEGDLMLAFDGASMIDIKDWSFGGGTVIVFSDSLAGLIDGVQVNQGKGKPYLATKVADHHLLYGAGSANFIMNEAPAINAHFSEVPEQAKVLMQGFEGSDFWRMTEAGPVMISLPRGEGEILLSCIDLDVNAGAPSQELLSLILTNAGVAIPSNKETREEIVIKKTVPVTLDGHLNEWLEDMEDRNVTQYIHAQPVYLTSENIVEGPPKFDLNLSAIDYFLWNDKALHIAGVVFGEDFVYETGIDYSMAKEYEQVIYINQDVITISVRDGKATVMVNDQSLSRDRIKVAQIDSKEMTDATSLQFNYIHASGKIATMDNLPGETFELMIPWELLKSTRAAKDSRAMISLASKGWKIQLPLKADPDSQENWMDIIFKDIK